MYSSELVFRVYLMTRVFALSCWDDLTWHPLIENRYLSLPCCMAEVMSVHGENSHPCSVRFLKVIQFCACDDHGDIQFFKLTALMSLQHIQLEGYPSITILKKRA